MLRRLSTWQLLLASTLLALGATPTTAQNEPATDAQQIAPAQWSDGVFSLRVFKARKGSFEEMMRLTQNEIGPFYERIGVRYIGFWRQIEAPGHEVSSEYDVVHMLTRYESVEHWQATRRPWAWGESDESFARMARAMFQRSSHVIEQEHLFFDGYLGEIRPRFGSDPQPAEEADFRPSCEAASQLQASAAQSYCACVSGELPEAPWVRAFFLSWLRVDGPERDDLSDPQASRVHDACRP